MSEPKKRVFTIPCAMEPKDYLQVNVAHRVLLNTVTVLKGESIALDRNGASHLIQILAQFLADAR